MSNVIEPVEEGGYAKYAIGQFSGNPYIEPFKSGHKFVGWKWNDRNDRILEPPYSADNNPFGPITGDTEFTIEWKKLIYHIETNAGEFISAEGDVGDNLTEISFWLTDDTTEENIIEIPVEDSGIIIAEGDYMYSTHSIIREDGKYILKLKILPNQTNEYRYLKFYGKSESYDIQTEEYEIRQIGNGQMYLPPFDYITFKYNWGQNDGTDLDSATVIRDSNLTLNFIGTLNDVYVGFGSRYNAYSSVNQYLDWAGDNTTSGDEGAFINWKRVITDMTNNGLIQGVTELHLDIYANWFSRKGDGNMRIVFETYESPNDSGMNVDKINHIFTPNPGTTMVTIVTTDPINVYALSFVNSQKNISQMKQFYSKVAVLDYDVKTKKGFLSEIKQQSGREIKNIKIKLDEEVLQIVTSTMTRVSKHIDGNQNSGSFILSEFSQEINGVLNTYYSINPDELELRYYGYSTEDRYVSAVVSESNGVYTVNWNCQANNTGNTDERNCDICVKVNTSTDTFTIRYSLYQSSL